MKTSFLSGDACSILKAFNIHLKLDKQAVTHVALAFFVTYM